MTAQLTHPETQQALADALTELLREPGIPAMHWSIGTASTLFGTAALDDARTAVAWFADLLDKKPPPPLVFTASTGQRVSENLSGVWRGVPINIGLTSDITAYPELMTAATAVAA